MHIPQYYQERDKLFAEQRAERKILLAHGIPLDEIKKLHAEDYKRWKANRIYALRNKTSAEEIGELSLSLAWQRRNHSSDPFEETGSFLDTIGNQSVLTVLKALSAEDLAMVEACLVKGMKQKDYADLVGKSRTAITRKLLRIKGKIELAVKM